MLSRPIDRKVPGNWQLVAYASSPDQDWEMARARRVLDRALAVANSAGVQAEGEILEGSPRRRITEFAHDRGARLIVVGSRGRKLRQSVSAAVIAPQNVRSWSLGPFRV